MPPVLVAVDGPADLEVVEAQLVRRYGRDYRVEGLADPDAAVQILTDLERAGESVALVLVGDRVAGAVGLFELARRLHPHARRALLVPLGAWADRSTAETILEARSLGRIDYYVSRPAVSQDELFHEAITSFLLEWATEQRIVPHTVHIVGEEWSGRAYQLREVFQSCAVPHTFCLADSDEGRHLLNRADPGARLPLMILPDGQVLSDPSDAEIAQAAGAPPDLGAQAFDLVIVGAGPAGLSAAVYGASEGLRILVIDEGGIGGQARSSSLIRNYLGFPKGLSGARLAEQAYEQASVFGASFLLMHRAAAITRSGQKLDVSLEDGRRINARAVILATGVSYRRLGVPPLEGLIGAGIFYGGPASEAPGLSGKQVFVAGGGNSAGQAALHLAHYARQVTLVVRAQSLGAGMSHYLVREIEATPNITVRTGTAVADGGGDGRLQDLVLRESATGVRHSVAADALFVLIGAHPYTTWLPTEIAKDEHGFLLTGDDLPKDCGWPLERRPFRLETSMPGVLAAGDVRHASIKRVASAVGEGSIAVQVVQNLLVQERLHPERPARASAAASGTGAS